MGRSGEILKSFGKKEKRFFEIKDGEEKKVKYLCAEEITSPFKSGKTIIRYHLEENGKKKLWDRISKQLARIMGEVEEGSVIMLKRSGQKNETRYEIKKIAM